MSAGPGGNAITFICPSCGGAQVSSANSAGEPVLRCRQCSSEQSIARAGREVPRHPLGPGPALPPELTGLNDPASLGQNLTCPGCHSRLLAVNALVSAECPFCGGTVQPADTATASGRLPIDAVVPFSVSEQVARERVEKWLPPGPQGYVDAMRRAPLTAVFVPFVVFDVESETTYRGKRAKDSYRKDNVTHYTGWDDVEGTLRIPVRDIEVPATQFAAAAWLQNREIQDWLEKKYSGQEVGQKPPASWSRDRAVPFNPAYLAGIPTRLADRALEECRAQAAPLIKDAVEGTLQSHVGGVSWEWEEISTRYGDGSFRQVLFPMYRFAVEYEGKPYVAWVDGVSGTVQGEAQHPADKRVYLGCLLAVVAVVVVLVIVGLVSQALG